VILAHVHVSANTSYVSIVLATFLEPSIFSSPGTFFGKLIKSKKFKNFEDYDYKKLE